ncbi:isochorismatase family protein [Massilia sp. CF038]|uniref:isochorismatase family protein n=1 Tax=Massilia sp. CF038 TaxID=1881045 RepID=UPI0009197E70|nr:isochorismatase family protein [Massilia sp. CF038]SHH53291.1 bifunctional isochorismate lyase / aryl carrier protein [Massilia sp. CF038]
MSIPRIATYPMPAATAMPSNRVDWKIEPARAVLLIHDMQDYFLDFYDSAAAPIPALLAQVNALRDACDAAGVPVVYTAQPAEQGKKERGLLTDWWGPGVTAQPHRASVAAALAPRAHDTVLVKWRYSAFVRSDLLARMQAQGRDQLIVCGVYAHIGCLMTAADAFMHDIQPFLVGDALADFSAEQHAMALDYVSQRCGVVSSAEQVMDALHQRGTLPASPAALRTEIAALLDVPASELEDDENLMFSGLDSIRLMSLLERWRRAGAVITFVELAEQPILAHWWQLLDAHTRTH